MKRTVIISTLLTLPIIISCSYFKGETIPKVELFPVKSGKEYQYIDREGKIIINPQFGQATVFRDELALIKTTSEEPKYGYVNTEGNYEINAQYKRATVFAEGLAWVVTENSAPSTINKQGEIKFTMQDAEYVENYSEGLAAYGILGEDGKLKWGFVDMTGSVKINPQFSAVDKFSENKCAVKNDEGKWGYIDQEGKILINNQFDDISKFENGYAIVETNNKKGVINAQGKYIINPQFTDIWNDNKGYLIEQDGKWGWCDVHGKIYINPQFSQAFIFGNNNLAPVKSGEMWGYIDNKGKIVINPQFEFALPFNGDLALVMSGNKVGFIDNEGKYVVNPQFDEISTDLALYLLNRTSNFERIETDYFNVGVITDAINFESPEGFTFDSTFEDLMKKYKMTEPDFSKYQTEYKVVENSKISNDATYSFIVVGKPFKETTVNHQGYYGSYATTEKVFNNSIKPNVYAYLIELQNKGEGKEDVVLKSLENKLKGFEKDIDKSEEENLFYRKENIEIQISKKNNNKIWVIISEKVESDDEV